MLGVVLWSDKAEKTAIVWCEDQGDLAFIDMQPHVATATHGFGAGDLIQFDVSEQGEMRRVRNPRRIAKHYCAGVDEVVAKASAMSARQTPTRDGPVAMPEPGACMVGNVISLSKARGERQRSVA